VVALLIVLAAVGGGAARLPAAAPPALLAAADSALTAPARGDSIPVPPLQDSLVTVPAPRDTALAAPAPRDTALAAPLDTARAVPAPRDTMAHAAAPPDTAVRWALVLSGGVARGFAQVGVLRALEEEGLHPDLVVGSSMGGLLGALYASGYSSREIERIAAGTDWSGIFGPRTDAYGWRDQARPRPWLRLVGVHGGLHGGLRFPSGLVDDSGLNHMLSGLFLDADAATGGDFDRLPVRFRTVGTDLATGRWIMLSRGGLARAVRATIGLPLVFPPIAFGGHLLVDGGMSANLPLDVAREAGATRLLAIDVAVPSPRLDENTPGWVVALQVFDMINKRGQRDTLTARDSLVWLKLPGISATDFAGADSIIQRGYDEAREPIQRWALEAGLPRSYAPPQRVVPLMPPLASAIEWRGGPVARASTARAVLGKLPAGSFQPHQLLPALDRLQRSGLFDKQWPSLEARGDSTTLVLDVREKPPTELSLAAALDNDQGGRLWAGLAYRPVSGPLPALVRLDGAIRQLGWDLNLSAEPYALDRGATGWFARATQRFTDTRIYENGGVQSLLGTDRSEALIGAQLGLWGRQVVQVGGGWAQTSGPGPLWHGALLAARTEGTGASHRLVEGEWAIGDEGYARLNGWVDANIKIGNLVVRPGLRAAVVNGTPPIDALPALGGPETLAGLHIDEWLGHRMGAFELRVAREFSGVFSVYAAGQGGVIEQPVGGVDLGDTPRIAFVVGGEVTTPLGPVRASWGRTEAGRERVDLLLGERF
jgi:predicted acylesterase/phospholipase RssA